MQQFLNSTAVIDWHHPAVRACAAQLAAGSEDVVAVAGRCYQWVRDVIRHSWDYRLNPVTCIASDVLEHRTGYCFAKCHLLAALLRANGIPAGFCYQRLSKDDVGEPFVLHGLNAIHLPTFGWYRVDPRGNRPGIHAQFTPPNESLAFMPRLKGEMDLPDIWPEPLPIVVDALRRYQDYEQLWMNLPDAPNAHGREQ